MPKHPDTRILGPQGTVLAKFPDQARTLQNARAADSSLTAP